MMEKLIGLLRDWGCDTKSALERMLGDAAFYAECLHAVANDPCFEDLKAAVDRGDVKRGFECAHTLKGVLGNVGLTPMYEINQTIVEPLRAGRCDALSGQVDILLRMREHLVALLDACA